MKIATMATGGIGGFLAVKLSLCGHQVATIARGPHLDAIRDNGLTLESSDASQRVRPWMATDDPREIGEVDAIIFGVKGDALVVAANACRPMIGPDTVVVPFLNGVEAVPNLLKVLPKRNIGNGLAQVSTTISAPGVIRQTGDMAHFIFAETDSRSSARIDRLRLAISEAGCDAPPSNDIERDVWAKFLMFSAVSGVTAAARCTMGDIFANPPLSELFRGVTAETATLARARGVAIPDDAEVQTWAKVQKLPPKMRASTAIDLEHNRPLEIDWISGAIVRLSRKQGLQAPLNAALYALLSPYKDGA